jgi:predicted PurR-regulated permease PerM
MSTPAPMRARAGSAIALWILAVIAVLMFLRAASQLLIPVVLAILISYVLEPVVAWLAAHRIHRIAGTTVLLLTLLGFGAWAAYGLKDEVSRVIEALPEAAHRARELVSGTAEGPLARVREAAAELQNTADAPAGGASPRPQGTAGGRGDERAHAPLREPSDPSPSSSGGQPTGSGPGALGASDLIQRGIGSVMALAGHLTIIFFLVLFLLLSGHRFRARVVEIAGPDAEQRERVASIIDDINTQIQRFLLVRLFTSTIVGLLTWIVLAWMNVESASVWGILAGVFNSIPYFGPIVVSGGLLVIGLVQGGGVTQAVQMSGAALLITSLEGWLLTPPLMGKAERMSVLVVLLGLLLWTWIWGAWGTILAVPMLVIVKAVADHTPALKPLGRLMAP